VAHPSAAEEEAAAATKPAGRAAGWPRSTGRSGLSEATRERETAGGWAGGGDGGNRPW